MRCWLIIVIWLIPLNIYGECPTPRTYSDAQIIIDKREDLEKEVLEKHSIPACIRFEDYLKTWEKWKVYNVRVTYLDKGFAKNYKVYTERNPLDIFYSKEYPNLFIIRYLKDTTYIKVIHAQAIQLEIVESPANLGPPL